MLGSLLVARFVGWIHIFAWGMTYELGTLNPPPRTSRGHLEGSSKVARRGGVQVEPVYGRTMVPRLISYESCMQYSYALTIVEFVW